MVLEVARRTVLVVDDSDDVRALVTLALKQHGYLVAQSSGAREALAWLATNQPPSLIILDLRMPDMDGHAFLGEQQRDAALRHIPVLIYSAEEIIAVKVDTGRRAFLSKSAPLSEMIEEARRLCG